jgi:hypothetical protein
MQDGWKLFTLPSVFDFKQSILKIHHYALFYWFYKYFIFIIFNINIKLYK